MDKITIGIDGDTSALEGKLSELQKKINSFRTGGAMNALQTGEGAGGSKEMADRMRQSKAEIFKRIQSQVSGELGQQVSKYKDITSQIDQQVSKLKELDKTTKSYQETLVSIKQLRQDEFQTMQGISKLQSQQQQMKSVAGSRNIMEKKDSGENRLLHAFKTGGVGGLNRAATRMGLGGLGGLGGMAAGGILAGVGGIGAGMTAYGQIQGFRAQLPFRQAERQTAIAKGTNQLGQRAINEQSAEDIMYAPERAKALESSMDFYGKAQDAREFRATGKAVGGLAAIGGAAYTGGMIGSAFGPVGTAVGAVAGAGMAAMSTFGSSEEAYYGLTGNKDALAQMTGKEAMQNYETQYTAEKFKDPGKHFQKQFMLKNRGRLHSLQRSAGLSDEETFGEGGFVRGSGADQFTFSQRAGMQEQMVQAGGSGQIGGGLQTMALQAQRSMGLTNAGQAMGRVTSYLSQEESKDAFIKVLAQGVSVGLDDSDFREEQKDYFNQVTSLAQNLGGNTDMVAAGMAAGIEGDVSRRGIKFAGDAYSAVGAMFSQEGGVTAAARASAMSKNEDYKNIKGLDIINFQNMQFDDINTGNAEMERYYKMSKGIDSDAELTDEQKSDFEKFTETRRGESREAVFTPYKETTMGKRALELIEIGKERELTRSEQAEMAGATKMFGGQSGLKTEEAMSRGRIITGQERKGDELDKEISDIESLKKQGVPLTEKQRRTIGDLKGGGTFLDDLTEKESIMFGKQMAGEKGGNNLGDTVKELSTSLFENLNQTLADQLTMTEFNKKMGEGADSVGKFVAALNEFYKNKPAKKAGSAAGAAGGKKPKNVSGT